MFRTIKYFYIGLAFLEILSIWRRKKSPINSVSKYRGNSLSIKKDTDGHVIKENLMSFIAKKKSKYALFSFFFKNKPPYQGFCLLSFFFYNYFLLCIILRPWSVLTVCRKWVVLSRSPAANHHKLILLYIYVKQTNITTKYF